KEQWFSPFLAGLIALSLHQAAYQAEINRTALQSVPLGQIEAGKALGLTRLQAFFLVTVPQAMHFVNGPEVQAKLSNADGRLAQWIASGKSDSELLEEMFVACTRGTVRDGVELGTISAPQTIEPRTTATT
ncbi:MAG: ABC transporter permease subunit, partial [Scytonema sp. CRU_2_7]|nr:ABC transporter permease subunit [Scytonema sp. CRU_2_7]